MRDKVIALLTNHDSLRGPDARKEYAEYITKVFDAAERVAALEARVAALESAQK
jgi:hypothetical protein